MSIELFQEVALVRDIPVEGLRAGDIATVVEALPATPESVEPGYALEVFTAAGESRAVIFVPVSAVRELRSSEILTARPLAKAS